MSWSEPKVGSETNDPPSCRMGLLAVLYGDGQLEVLAVPSPDCLANLGATDMEIDQVAALPPPPPPPFLAKLDGLALSWCLILAGFVAKRGI